MKLEQRSCRDPGSAFDELVGRVDREGPDFDEAVFGIPLLHDHSDRLVHERKTERLGKGAVHGFGFGRRFPLAVDRAEATRKDDPTGRGVGHLEEVFAAVGFVERPRRIAGPRERFHDDAIEAEPLLGRVPRMKVVDSQRRRLERTALLHGEPHERYRQHHQPSPAHNHSHSLYANAFGNSWLTAQRSVARRAPRREASRAVAPVPSARKTALRSPPCRWRGRPAYSRHRSDQRVPPRVTPRSG